MAGVTKEEIALAKELDLLTYFKLVEPGNLKLVGKEYRHKVHSSLTISKDSLWCWHCIGLRGRTALKYLIDVEKVPYVEAVREINRIQGGVVHSSQPVSLPQPRAEPEAPRDFKLPKVDDGSLKFNPAVELSYLSPTEQNDFLDYIESQSCSPSLSQAQKLKAASKDGALDHGKLLEIMDTKKPSVPPRDPTLTISVSKIARYFPTGYTQEQMVGIIMQLLERNSRHLMPEKQPSLER